MTRAATALGPAAALALPAVTQTSTANAISGKVDRPLQDMFSFGSIGPSLVQYGSLRGVVDAADPASSAVPKYCWGKL
jgi:hypothetical protein